MSSEAEIQARIRLAVGALPGVRLFRNNRGRAWMGKLIGQVGSTVTLAQPRHVEFGLVDGASDLIGLTAITITPEMVGQRVAIFTAGEVKRPGEPVPEHQRNFLNFVQQFGGRAAVLRSPADALELVKP